MRGNNVHGDGEVLLSHSDSRVVPGLADYMTKLVVASVFVEGEESGDVPGTTISGTPAMLEIRDAEKPSGIPGMLFTLALAP